MLEELIKHDKVGTKAELSFLLFQILTPNEYKEMCDVKTLCLYHSYTFGSSFAGIIQLLNSLGLIHIKNRSIKLDSILSQYNPETFFDEDFFFDRLFNYLKKSEALDTFFNYQNTKLDKDSLTYYVKESQMPLTLSGIKKLLINTGFFIKPESIKGIYFINPHFNKLFKIAIVPNIKKASDKKKITLLQLKKNLLLQEQYGEMAEEFVLCFELRRLQKHPQQDEIKKVSNDFANAGFDIESFNTEDSIALDRLIEVKSYYIECSFYWSKNEIETAKVMRELYYLYLVDRSKIKAKDYQPYIIKDPYKTIFLNEEWTKDSASYFIYRNDK